jgi:hypothetical protein
MDYSINKWIIGLLYFLFPCKLSFLNIIVTISTEINVPDTFLTLFNKKYLFSIFYLI